MIKQKDALEWLLYLFILATPFVTRNHVILYVIIEIIGLIGLINVKLTPKEDFILLKVMGALIIWGVIVSSLSVLPKTSFHEFTIEILLMVMYIGLSKIDFNYEFSIKLNQILVFTGFFTLFQSISVILRPYNQHINKYSVLLFGNGISKVYISTLALIMIVLALFFIQNKTQKYLVIITNIIATSLIHDVFFFFVLLSIGLFYYLNYKRKVSFIKIITCIAVLSALLLAGLIYLKAPLHIYNRLLIYEYWIPKILLSPIYGYGISLKLLANYIPAHYPLPLELTKMDAHANLHSHNFIVDTTLQQGIIGLIIYLMLPIVLFRKLYKSGANIQPFLYMCYAIFVKNLVDDQFEGTRYLTFWLFIFLVYLMSQTYSQLKKV